jgi:hypothetical protein
MPENPSLEGLQEFLFENIESYEQLACLLALAARAGAECRLELVAEILYLPPAVARSALHHLVRRRLLVESGEPGNPAFTLDRLRYDFVIDLEKLYRSQPLVVVHLMNANALQRVRHEAAKRFSDAFLIRKKEPDG